MAPPPLTQRNKIIIGVVVGVALAALVIGLAVGLTQHHSHEHHDSSQLAPSKAAKVKLGTPLAGAGNGAGAGTADAAKGAAATPPAKPPAKPLLQKSGPGRKLDTDKVEDAHVALVQEAKALAEAAKPPPNFPIHAMFTWVNGEDEEWRASKRDIHNQLFGKPHVENPRDPMRAPGNRDELYYSVHCVTKFCPWLERVWVLSARGHRPAWLGLGSGDGRAAATALVNGIPVTVVHHDRVMDMGCVAYPTFNSYVIESEIPHIAQLAEHFIMFNDDFFVGQPMRRQDFFTDAGVPVVYLRDASSSINALPTMWGQHLRNHMALCKRLGLGKGLIPEHVAAPVRKSILAAVVKATAHVGKCSMLPFRAPEDFPAWYVALNGVKSAPRPPHIVSKYFGTGMDFAHYMGREGQAPHLFCINQEFTKEAQAYLQTILGSS